jgi:TldD protein
MPPSVQYAKDVAEGTPEAYADEAQNQRLEFPVQIGYNLSDGTRGDAVVDATLEVALDDLRQIDALGRRRETVTGTCVKHESRLPFAVTAPAVRLPATLR